MSKGRCEMCCGFCELEVHHIFPGSLRNASDRWGATIRLCHDCHQSGADAAHRSGETMIRLKKYGQRKVMTEQGWDLDRWLKEFGKSYLSGDELHELLEAEIEDARDAGCFELTDDEMPY